jgi:hypothetical protein
MCREPTKKERLEEQTLDFNVRQQNWEMVQLGFHAAKKLISRTRPEGAQFRVPCFFRGFLWAQINERRSRVTTTLRQQQARD